jgi:hypothetical protein
MPLTNPSSQRPRKAARGHPFFRAAKLVGYSFSIAFSHRAIGLMLAEGPCRAAMIAASPYRFAIVEPRVMQAASFARQRHSAHAEKWILDSPNQSSLAQSGETILDDLRAGVSQLSVDQ